MNDPLVRSLLAKTALSASRGEFEPFKASSIFDSTAQNPDWLGERGATAHSAIDANMINREDHID